MANNQQNGRHGVGIFGLLGIAFIILKLCHVIEWSWIWVLSPFWIYVVLVVVLYVICKTL